MAYSHGSKRTTSQGSRTYEVKDSYNVLDNIPDTPEYWKKKKYEILAKLDNFGPFQSLLRFHVVIKDGKKILESYYMK